MIHQQCYRVVLLPRMEVAASSCSLGEASAWMRSYNEVMSEDSAQAVIAEDSIAQERGQPTSRRRDRRAI